MNRSFVSYSLILFVAIVVGTVLNALSREQHVADQEERLTLASASFVSVLEQAIHEKVLINKGISAVFEADQALSLPQFMRTAETMLAESEAVLNIAVAPDLVVEYVYPLQSNQSVIGLDLRQRPDFARGVNRAIEQKATILDGPFDLVQGGQGFILRSPVLVTQNSAEARRVWGMISLVIDKNMLFTSAGFFENSPNLELAVHNHQGDLLFGAPDLRDKDPITAPVQLYGVDWVVSVAPPDGWAQSSPNMIRLWAVVAFFTVLALLVMRAFNWAYSRRQRAETQLMEAIEALEDGFALYDKNDRLIACNQRYRELYRVSADAMVIGKSFEDILRYGLKKGQYEAALGREEEWLAERLRLHTSYGTPTEQELNDGRWLRVVERLTPSGNIVGFRVDITSLKDALARAEAASAAKSYFLNAVSHELRTPLTVVLGYNTFLANPEILPTFRALEDAVLEADTNQLQPKLAAYNDDVKRFSKQIDTAGHQLMALINGILDLAALEEGTLQLRRQVVSLTPICKSVVEQLQADAEKKGLKITIEGNAADVFADPTRIRQILYNLVGNAVKFSADGDIIIRLSTSNDMVLVEVQDCGDGLAPEDQAQIFDRFGQLDKSNARATGGIGLGLPISRELAELHGGTLEVRSEKGEGSVFRLKLLAHRDQTEAAAQYR